jgi:hypothetical protein
MPEDVVSQDEQITPEPKPEEPIAAAGNSWNGEKWEDRTPRDDQGRFARIRANLAKANQKTEFLKALDMGAVEPSDDMDPELWSRARNNQLRNRTAGIEMPELPADQTGENAEGLDAPIAEETISPEHERLCNGLIARSEDPAVQGLNQAIGLAKEAGAQPKFHYDLARFASEHPNGEKVLLHLGEHPEKLVHFFEAAVQSPNPREQLRHLVDALSERLSTAENARAVQVKPKPPDPVSTRASSSAFDVNDESTDPDTWARKRNEQVAKSRRR